MCLVMALILVREEHDAELAYDRIEAGIREQQGRRIGGLELDLLVREKFPRATSSIGGLRSVAVKCASRGNRSRRRRVTMPVPAAISRTRMGAEAAARRAISSARSVKNTGPSPWS
jgi:hypothetical protein